MRDARDGQPEGDKGKIPTAMDTPADPNKRPWRLFDEADNGVTYIMPSGTDDNDHDAAIYGQPIYDTATFSPEFICRAVNSHDALVAALKRIAEVDVACMCCGDCQCNFAEAKRIAESALVTAEGRKD